MSRPQEPGRPFFPFVNPFKILTPKGSILSPGLLALLNNFELTLTDRLKKLIPEDNNDVLSLSWMKLAMELLCQTHIDIKCLITELELPVSKWDEKWIDVYLDISVKLLDLCIAFSSELTRLSQSHLLLQCFLRNLESNSPELYVRTRSSLESWRQHASLKNPRVENCRSILDDLVKSLDLPKVKNSAKGKVLMRAMYAVKVTTIYVCSVFAAAFSGSAKNLLDLDVPNTLVWAGAFSDVQTTINEEIRNIFSQERVSVVKELDVVDANVKKLYPMIQDVTVTIEKEAISNSVSDLRRAAEKLSEGLDHLAKEVDGFFKIILGGRDALLCNLRSDDAVTESKMGNVEEQSPRRL
ncbi:protein BPS1, chloroplastic-like [Carica papaya]|uniref:protein BPS1, chloroplastic-like n=1 Tax=Carica papaya TaxID=3649 RepID=UPI000B8D0F26|nr:protein BPS1, chloroplastic-like [Carica papaya]XP_021887795.1 protein BPS1, chloroplastic-like [Carica papaya]